MSTHFDLFSTRGFDAHASSQKSQLSRSKFFAIYFQSMAKRNAEENIFLKIKKTPWEQREVLIHYSCQHLLSVEVVPHVKLQAANQQLPAPDEKLILFAPSSIDTETMFSSQIRPIFSMGFCIFLVQVALK